MNKNLEKKCPKCLAHNIGPDHECPPLMKFLKEEYDRNHPTTQKKCCVKCNRPCDAEDCKKHDFCGDGNCDCHTPTTQKTLPQLIDEAVAEFDQRYHRAGDNGESKHFLRAVFKTFYWQGARDATTAVVVPMLASHLDASWNACHAEQQRRAALFLKDQK